MSTYRIPAVIPLARAWPQRLWQAVTGRLSAWQASVAQTRARHQVCDLPQSTLADAGVPEEWRHAAALCRQRAQLDRELLRQGIVPGAFW
jgi:hypothetical protein